VSQSLTQSSQMVLFTLRSLRKTLHPLRLDNKIKLQIISYNMIKYFSALIFLITGFVFISSCTDPIIGNKNHLPPNTYLSVFSILGDTLAPGKTIKKISWWGDSPNGYVVSFKISFDSLNWGNTTSNDSTFIFSLSGQDSAFRIWVAAVDDQGYVDPVPASNLYPVVNSAPSMIFDPSLSLPDTIFPIATIKWIGSDPDGDITITNYWYSLNDTLHFKPLAGNLNIMTLTKDSGLVAGGNCIYMKAMDNARAFSPVVRMPQDSSKLFYVKYNNSKILLIKDMPVNEMSAANSYFGQVMDTIHYDVLDIKSNAGANIPKITNPMFIETLKLFKIVIWAANRNGGANPSDDPNLPLAQNSLPFYLNAGGKVFWTSGFPNVSIVQGSLFNFAPIDSIKTSCFIQLNAPGDTISKTATGYPDLYASFFIAHTNGIYLTTNPPGLTQSIFQLLPNPNRPNCTDISTVGFKSPATNPKLVFMLMPIYYLNGNVSYSKAFINQVLINEFSYGSKIR
jgi:hypothetical protein